MSMNPSDLIAKHHKRYVVYALYLGLKCQYVGQTRDIKRRLQSHYNDKSFNAIWIGDHDEKAKMFNNEERQAYMNYVETCLILDLKPALNKKQISDDNMIELFYALPIEAKRMFMDRFTRACK